MESWIADVPPPPLQETQENHLLLAVLAATAFLALCVLGAWRRHRRRRAQAQERQPGGRNAARRPLAEGVASAEDRTMERRLASRRLRRYVARCSGEEGLRRVETRLAQAADADFHGGQDPERMEAALVLTAGPDLAKLSAALDLARQDWRDLLVAAGLANEDWPEVLGRVLGARDATAP